MQDKFNLTKEQNIFLAKKALVVSIYNIIRLEGINTTYSDTKTILEGVNVPNLKPDEINCILNLRDAWNYVLSHIDDPLNLDFICQINAYVSRNESLEWGVLRTGKIGINGVDYVPPIPDKQAVISQIETILKEENITSKSIHLMLYLMRAQVFWDGNKRTSMIIANKILIQNGCGIISIKEENIREFNTLLTEYYNTGNQEKISTFLYDKCLFGLEITAN